MKTTQILCLTIIFYLTCKVFALRNCGEFHENSSKQQLKFEEKIADVFDNLIQKKSLNDNELFKLLKDVKIDPATKPKSNYSIKSIVSSICF